MQNPTHPETQSCFSATAAPLLSACEDHRLVAIDTSSTRIFIPDEASRLLDEILAVYPGGCEEGRQLVGAAEEESGREGGQFLPRVQNPSGEKDVEEAGPPIILKLLLPVRLMAASETHADRYR